MLVVDGLGLSGKTKALADLAIGLDPLLYRPTVVCFREESGPLPQLLRSRGVRLLVVPLSDGLSIRNLWRMTQVIRSEQPDIVHGYNPRAILYAGLAARIAGVRAVLGSLSAFACLVPDQQYEFLPQPLATKTLRNRIRNRFSMGLVSRIAVVSMKLGERFCAYNGISPQRLRLVRYGVQTGEPPGSERRLANRRRVRADLGFELNDIVIGGVGRLVEQKDYGTQLRGFAMALRDEPDLRMFIVGAGPLRESLQALAVELNVHSRVQFMGYRSDVPDLFQAMDIYALTSIFEPFGIAVLEAKANGVPIVCAAVNELPEILSHGKCGELFEAASPRRFADAVLKLARDPALRSTFAEAAFREAEERHGLAGMIRCYEGLYEEICREARS